ELDRLPDPVEAHRRRGAPFTFNPHALVSLVRHLRNEPHIEHIKAPSFDHAIGDPVEDDIVVLPFHKILILEGLYLHLAEHPWKDVHNLADESWFVECSLEVAKERLVRRHVASGICKDEQSAAERAEANDLVNAIYILEHSLPPSRVFGTG
ncbi:hypothetical protein HK097_006629, partial [Rhizophlyctis rosea]